MLSWIIDDYLARTTLIVGTVVLINDDGILNIIHYDVLKQNIPNKTVTGPGPRFYPNTIIRSREDCIS